MTGKVLYTAENEYPTEQIPGFLEWYAFRHAPDLSRQGFLSCATYRAIEGGFNLLGLYELDSLAVFESPGYKGLQARDRFRANIAAHTLQRAHTVYVQRSLHPLQSIEDVPVIDADWLAMLRFDADEATRDEIVDWFGSTLGPRLESLGAKRFRIAHREGERPNSVTSRPQCLIVGEWTCRPPAGAQTWRELIERFALEARTVESYAGRRAFPWPDLAPEVTS